MTFDRVAQLAIAAVLGAAAMRLAGDASAPHMVHAPDISCAQFRTQSEAQRAYDVVRHAIDRDGDGLACEALP